ncbi:MAG: hypothetical protein AAF571_09825 [Verrucomicrobiota bacterium]
MKSILPFSFFIFAILTLSGCAGISTHVYLQKDREISKIEIVQEEWGFSIFAMALYGLDIQFNSDHVDHRGVIPASNLTIKETGISSPLHSDDNIQSPYRGFIQIDEEKKNIEIRLYVHLIDIYGKDYFPQHPINGVYNYRNYAKN